MFLPRPCSFPAAFHFLYKAASDQLYSISCLLPAPYRLLQAVRRLWALINRSVESALARQPERPVAAVEKEVKGRYLVLDTKQRSLSLSQEGMALLFNLLLQEPEVVFRCGWGLGARLRVTAVDVRMLACNATVTGLPMSTASRA